MRKSIAAVLACTMLAGCVYAPPPGYHYVQGYGYVAPGGVDSGATLSGEPYAYAPAYAAPGYVEAYPDYAGAAVGGLALGALAGLAIGSSCCYGGYHRGYGGYGRGYGGYARGYGGGYGGGWHGGHRR